MPSLLLAGATIGLCGTSAAAPVLVLPLSGPDGGAETAWLGEAVAALLPDALTRFGVPTLGAWDRVELLRGLGLSPGAGAVTRATALRLGEAAGLDTIVMGIYVHDEGRVTIELRVVSISEPALGPPVAESGPPERVQDLVDRAALRIATAPPFSIATSDEPSSARRRIKLGALRAFARALAGREPAEVGRQLAEALREDPVYDEARLALARVQLDAGNHEAAIRLLTKIPPEARLFHQARFLEGRALLELQRSIEAADIFEALTQRQPSASTLTNQALALLRNPRRRVAPSVLLRKACDLSGFQADIVFNLAWALLLEGQAEASAFWMRSLTMDEPEDIQARVVLSWALRRAGRVADANEEWSAVIARAPAYAPLMEPRFSRRFERIVRSLVVLPRGSSRQSQARLAAAHLERGDRLLSMADSKGALRELTRAAYLNPYDDRVHRRLADAHRALGDARSAINELRMAVWCRDTAQSRVLLAEALASVGAIEAARHQAQAALELDPTNAAAQRLSAQ